MAINNNFRTPEQIEKDNALFKLKQQKYLNEKTIISFTTENGDNVKLNLSREEAQKLVSFSGLLDDLYGFKHDYELNNARF